MAEHVRVSEAVLNALKVLTWDRRTRAWLKENDPKALEQADKAIRLAGDSPACGWENLGH